MIAGEYLDQTSFFGRKSITFLLRRTFGKKKKTLDSDARL